MVSRPVSYTHLDVYKRQESIELMLFILRIYSTLTLISYEKQKVINFHVFYFLNTHNLGGVNVLFLSPSPYVRTNLLGRMTL